MHSLVLQMEPTVLLRLGKRFTFGRCVFENATVDHIAAIYFVQVTIVFLPFYGLI